jgi:hypothetical protein
MPKGYGCPYPASLLRPLARLRFNTKRPDLSAIRARKPCLRFLRKLLGWKVIFMGA